MNRYISCLFQFGLVLSGAFLGGLLALQVPDLIHNGAFVAWHAFHLPGDQRAVRFVGVEGERVLVETDSGMWFVLPLSFDKTPSWRQVESSELAGQASPPGGGACRATPYNERSIVRPLLRKTVDKLYCWYSPHAEYDGDLIFAIDRNGGVYRWFNPDMGYGMVFWLPACGGAGVLFGAAIGLYTYLRFVKRRETIKEYPPAAT
ncbi:MAG: hypothetical protein GTO14_11140 [Anaerolineales bacterium]|nr:hypothetical protein [Anaerolineales bacterium]